MEQSSPSTPTVDPVLVAVLQAARDATGAGRALVLSVSDDELVVVAGDGEGTAAALGQRVSTGQGIAGFVAAAEQPVALRPTSSDPRLAEDIGAVLGWAPGAVVAVPCSGDEGVVGVLQLLDAAEGGFDFDAVEAATLLAGVAAAALEAGGAGPPPPTPSELAGDLARLAEAEASRYAIVATLVRALLDRG